MLPSYIPTALSFGPDAAIVQSDDHIVAASGRSYYACGLGGAGTIRGQTGRPMMRLFVALVCCFTFAASLFLHAPASAQTGFDRPGGDYPNCVVRSGDPAACALRCEREGRCRAWTFSYPQANNVAAVCWLKNKVTPRVENTCCVSGVRGAAVREPKGGPIEF